MASTSNTGHRHIRVGDVTVTVLNDGVFKASTQFLDGVDAAEAEAMLHQAHRPVPPIFTINTFLLQVGDRAIVVDAGMGPGHGEALGLMPRNLAAMGVAPGAVDTVLLTHLHSDHFGGLVDEAGAAYFPNARLVMHADEAGYWLDEASAAAAPEAARATFEGARHATAPYQGRIERATSGEVAPGVSIEPLPGHTPGHSGYLVRSGGDSLLIWGDIVHVPAIQFARPEIGMKFDADIEQARRTRLAVLERAASERLRVAGMHHEFPTFGFVAKAGSGFSFVPEFWQP